MAQQDKIKQNEQLRTKYEKAFRPVVKKALKSQYSSYTSSLRTNGAQYVLSHPAANLIDAQLSSAIQQMYTRAGVAKATLTYRTLQRLPRIEKKRGSLGFNAQWTSDILSYFRLHLFNKVVLPISETTQEYILKILNEGISEGWAIDEMVARIEREDYIDGRVERIIRTEINRAINYGNDVAARSYEYVTQKKWVSVHDDRTRHPHAEADGQTVDMDGTFKVSGENLDFPGDPNGSAENTINCRCHTEIVAVRNSAGRLIPKENQPVRVTGRLRSQVQDIIRDLNN